MLALHETDAKVGYVDGHFHDPRSAIDVHVAIFCPVPDMWCYFRGLSGMIPSFAPSAAESCTPADTRMHASILSRGPSRMPGSTRGRGVQVVSRSPQVIDDSFTFCTQLSRSNHSGAFPSQFRCGTRRLFDVLIMSTAPSRLHGPLD